MYQPTLIAVEALLHIEHDRLPRVPGTESAFFSLDSESVPGLESIGAVRRVGATQASAATVQQVLDTSAQAFEGMGAVTFADVGDATSQASAAPLVDPGKPLFDAEATLGILAEAQSALQAQNLERVAARDQADQAGALKVALTERDEQLAQRNQELDQLREALAVADAASADAAAEATSMAADAGTDGGAKPAGAKKTGKAATKAK